jgi:hypothetical protein
MARVDVRGGTTAYTCNAHGSWLLAGDIPRLRGAPPARAPLAYAGEPAAEILPPEPKALTPRPTALVVIAWLWIVFGGFWSLFSVPALIEMSALSGEVDRWNARYDVAERAHEGLALALIVLLLVLAGAAAGAVCGVGLLRLREWARRGLVFLTWALLLYVVGFLVFFMWTSLPALDRGMVEFHVGGVMGLVVLGGPLWWTQRALRGPAIREATAHPYYFR